MTMTPLLDQINSPADLKKVPQASLPQLAEEIRDFIIKTISNTGGHLASSLGVVELTIALHYIYNTPVDKIIWDVGHQSYAHKILTGRRDRFHLMRQEDGLSGFPNIEESEYDCFGTGHASTSISAALGIAEARDRLEQDFNVIAVIGDGALGGGMAFEALNHAGDFEKKNLTVIVNDNKMSISPNVGALSSYLGRIITGARYNRFKGEVEALLKSIPSYGDQMLWHAKKLQERIKAFVVPEVIFQELGFKYVGPIEGHNFKHLLETLNNVRNLRGPILIHVVTKKGKGYNPSEKDAAAFHGVSPFYISNGHVKKHNSQPSYTDIFAKTLIHLAKKDPK
ncbi:1-deoxy-D-xylulose-5-phosphate synthase, partial [bacterium]|nr:1-deoxy-D-xylulose-5-phosphate synthase [bacterium]